MLVVGHVTLGIAVWVAWSALGTGVAVTGLVIGGGVILGRLRRRRRQWEASREEDLPWDDLLAMIEKHNQDRAAKGMPPEEVSEALLTQLVSQLPALPNARPVERPEDRDFQESGETNRRSSRRRWGNPTEIYVRSYLWTGPLHALVVNRSTGGLGIYMDKEAPPGTPLRIRAKEAPESIPLARAEVRHCRKVSGGYFIGCEFVDDVPWNVRVWFG
jgi:hypothetical protein